jgi:hypothetical protein
MSEATWPTEAERKARLCKRAGCDCEERAMTDPTPEEDYAGFAYGLCPTMHAPAAECGTCENIANALRAAVEAEREACLKEVQRIRDLAEFHQTQRDPVSICFTIAAAIRSRGERE